MKRILYILSLLPLSATAQSNGNAYGIGNSASVTGSVSMPSLMRIDVTDHHKQVVLNRIEDYENGKVAYDIASLNVKSSRPWIVNIMTEGQYASPSSVTSSRTIPVSMFSLKESSSDQFVVVGTSAQPLIRSNNSSLENNYTLDMLVKPPFGHQSGVYTTNIIFTLTQQ